MSWSAPTTAWASARDSAWKSMSCHAVSVPPQSKITASIGMAWMLGLDHPYDVVDDRLYRDVPAPPRGPVAGLGGPLRQVAADPHDRGHTDDLGVLELHPGADLR